MQEDDNRDFDLYVRSMFEDAEEEVPSRIWNAVSSRMAAHVRKPAIVWWRRAAVSAAAIAAVASGIFLSLHDSTLPNTDEAFEVVEKASTTSGLAQLMPALPETLPTEAVPELTARERFTAHETAKPSEALAAQDQDVAGQSEVPAVQSETEEEVSQEMPVQNAPVREVPVQESPAQDVQVQVDADFADPFTAVDSDDDASGRRSGRFSFSAGGNAQTNTVSGNGIAVKPFMAPGASTVPEKTTVKDQGKSTFGIPISVGLGVSYRFSPKWSVGAGLSATRLTRSFAGKYTEIAEDGSLVKTVTGDIDQTLIYVGVPLNVYFDILKNHAVRFYTYGGGTIEKGISNRYTIHDKSSDIHFKGGFDGLQFSAGIGMGVELKLVGGLGLYVDPSLRYYFDCSQPTSIRTEEPLMMTMDIGFRFNF